MTRYELIVDINGYDGVSGLSTIGIVNGGYGWAIGNTFSIGTGGAVGAVTGVTSSGGIGFRFEIMSIDAFGGITSTNLTSGGSGYIAGEYFLVDGGSGSYGQIITVNGSGSVLTYSILTSGSGYTLNDIDTVTLQPVATSATVVISGLGYSIGTTYTTSGSGFSLTVIGVTINIIRNQYLDTYEEEGISLNYQISDISDISTSNTSYSKTINLPDTKLNRITFEYIFGLNSYSEFDPGKKSRCWIIKDTSTQFTGYIQLTNIIYDRKTNKNEYQVNIYADNDTLWTNIGEKFLSDLDVDSYSHTYSNTNIVNSWSRDYTSGYYYPLLDYVGNMDYNLVSAPSGVTNSLTAINFKPAIYTKIIIDQIFTEAGYTYTSDFLNSSLFKNLVIPNNNSSLIPSFPGLTFSTTNVIAQFNSTINVTASQLFTFLSSGTPTYTYKVKTNSFNCNNDLYDPNGFYDTSTYEYIHNTTGTFVERFRIDVNMIISANGLTSSTLPTFPWLDRSPLTTDDVYIMVRRSMLPDGSSAPGWTNTPSINQLTSMDFYTGNPNGPGYLPVINFDGVSYLSLRSSSDISVSYATGSSTASLVGTIYTDDLISSPLRYNEKVRFFFFRGPYNSISSVSEPLTQTTPSMIVTSILNTTTATIGSYLNISNNLPNNIKQRDFLSSIIKMFNLYIEPDKLNANNFRVEPRDDYYYKYKVVKDWSSKLDVSKPINSQIASNTQNRKNIFSYKTDKDFYNTTYTNETSQIYGQYEWDVNNEFISDEKKIEPIFSGTPIDQLLGNSNIYLSTITNNSSSAATTNGMNIRILYKNVLPLTSGNVFRFNSTNNSFYPYAGPFDNPLNPTISLNFGQVAAFYPSFNDTINNLFYGYWQDTMQELSDPTSRIITAYFYLNSVDISQFYFSDLIFFTLDGQDGYYRVNKIIDYDPSSTTSTKVELLKTKYYSAN
jgi:hypothetical protein